MYKYIMYIMLNVCTLQRSSLGVKLVKAAGNLSNLF